MSDALLPFRLLVDSAYKRAGEIVHLLPHQVVEGKHAPLDAASPANESDGKLEAALVDIADLKIQLADVQAQLAAMSTPAEPPPAELPPPGEHPAD
jgi:hypothetical protein